MTEELKPCPLCDRPLKMLEGDEHFSFDIICTNEACPIMFAPQSTKEQAVRLCNTRQSIPISEVEGVIEKFEEIKKFTENEVINGTIGADSAEMLGRFTVSKFAIKELQELIRGRG